MLGECGLAAVLSDRLGGAVGAIGLVAPSDDWPLDDAVVGALRAAARSVSRELGAALLAARWATRPRHPRWAPAAAVRGPA